MPDDKILSLPFLGLRQGGGKGSNFAIWQPCLVFEPATAAPLSSFCVILLRGREGDAGGLYAVPEEADVAREPGVDAAQLVLRVTQSLVLGCRLLLSLTLIHNYIHSKCYNLASA